MDPRPAYGCVVLTQGRRLDDLHRALDSLRAQQGVGLDIVVVGNAWAPTGLPDGVRGIERPTDDGIPAGRNYGVPHVAGDLLFFLDDDASLGHPDALAKLAEKFRADPTLAMVQTRVEPSEPGRPASEWVPRLRTSDRLRSGDVTHVWEGAVAIRRAAFEAVGGWPEEFRFVHEGVDLAWRLLDAGYRVHYAGDVFALHRPYRPGRHEYHFYFGARNRVWLARRYLPWPLAVPFVATFALRTLARMDSSAGRRAALRGYRDGLRGDGPGRRRLHTRTLVKMTRLGRPPLL